MQRPCSVELNVKVEADNYSTLKNLVKTHHGLTILPLAPIHDEISKGGANLRAADRSNAGAQIGYELSL